MAIATYLVLNLCMLALIAALLWRWLPKNRKILIVVIFHLFVLTAIFDSLIIYYGIVGYDPAKILGITIWLAPIEDFFYAIAAALMIPAFWTIFNARKSEA